MKFVISLNKSSQSEQSKDFILHIVFVTRNSQQCQIKSEVSEAVDSGKNYEGLQKCSCNFTYKPNYIYLDNILCRRVDLQRHNGVFF